ncbi:MAG: SPOR domain-containing protein [Pseudomonadota bacterium]
MRSFKMGHILPLLAITVALSGCEEGAFSSIIAPSKDGTATQSSEGTVEERDVEAPDVFSVREAGLWDGRPSLGGVWAAHPDVKEPERIIIRNLKSDTFVIGALFRKERETPGPRLQISSDAAEALGMIAGQPVDLSVVALRREKIEIAPPVSEETVEISEASDVEVTPLDGAGATAAAAAEVATEAGDAVASAAPSGPTDSEIIAAAAAAAIAEAEAEAAASAATPAAAPKPAALPSGSVLRKPFIQIGIFSVEANANRTGDTMRGIGIVPQILKQSSRGKTFWRVIVGPANTTGERAELLKKIKDKGFTDAYFVTN